MFIVYILYFTSKDQFHEEHTEDIEIDEQEITPEAVNQLNMEVD